MHKLLFRLAFLLAVLTLVGWAGLNSSLDPSRIQRASALEVSISVTGAGPANSLGFSIGGAQCPADMLPSEACTAVVTITHVGTLPLTLSAPTSAESGVLKTCTGDDPASPGIGGNNLSTAFGALSYTPNSTVFQPGQTTSFQISVTLDAAATNACQGKSGDIAVTINSFEVVDDTPAPPQPQPPVTNPQPPVPLNPPLPPLPVIPQGPGQPLGQQAPVFTAQVQGNVNVPAPVATLTAEVQGVQLPAALPKSGQGFGQHANDAARMLLFGTGLLAAGLLLLALGLAAQRRGQR